MNYIFIILFYFLGNSYLFSQIHRSKNNEPVNKNYEKKTLALRNIDGIKILIPANLKNGFSITTDSLKKGFYELEEIGTVYLSQDFKLSVLPVANGGYTFTGIGAIENNALRKAKKKLEDFMPVSPTANYMQQFTQAGYYVEPPVFLAKMDSLEQFGVSLFNSSTDTFFRKIAGKDFHFFIKNIVYWYGALYGTDIKKMEQLPELMNKLDKKAPDYVQQFMKLSNSIRIKTMDHAYRQKLDSIVNIGWDINNEELFRNSLSYQIAIKNYFNRLNYNPKYSDPIKEIAAGIKPESADLKTLKIAKGELTNTYILDWYQHSLTSSILKTAKDTGTLKRYYNQYITTATRQDYINDIQEIYANAVSFSDNTMAPDFTYNDISGSQVSLQSLRGKYVYIDVWATWCGPCIGEIPHLKKIEALYTNNNIAFVSISVDEAQNRNKWRSYVLKNKLKGIQLMTNNALDSPFINKLRIVSIPRFILIDPFGKLISADAFRPSDEKLKAQLDILLN